MLGNKVLEYQSIGYLNNQSMSYGDNFCKESNFGKDSVQGICEYKLDICEETLENAQELYLFGLDINGNQLILSFSPKELKTNPTQQLFTIKPKPANLEILNEMSCVWIDPSK